MLMLNTEGSLGNSGDKSKSGYSFNFNFVR